VKNESPQNPILLSIKDFNLEDFEKISPLSQKEHTILNRILTRFIVEEKLERIISLAFSLDGDTVLFFAQNKKNNLLFKMCLEIKKFESRSEFFTAFKKIFDNDLARYICAMKLRMKLIDRNPIFYDKTSGTFNFQYRVSSKIN